jgi:hypothetical protein
MKSHGKNERRLLRAISLAMLSGLFDDDDEHDDETRLNSVSCGFGAGNFFEKMMEVEGL